MGTSISSGRWKVDYADSLKRVYRDTSVTPLVTDDVNTLQGDLQDLFDEPAQMDNDIPISAQTPTEFTVGGIEVGQEASPWFFDPRHLKYLSGGAIQTANWTRTTGSSNGIVRVPYDGTTDPVESDIGKVITHNVDGDTGTLVGFDTVEGWLFIRPADDTAANDFDSASGTFNVTSGTAGVGAQTAAASTGEYLWANPNSVNVLAVQTGTRPYVYSNGAKVTNWPAGIGLNADGEFDILLMVKENDTLIDNGFATFFARRGAALGDWFEADLSNGGRVTIPLTGNPDLVNDGIGHHNATWTGGSGATLTAGEVVSLNSDSEVAAVVVNVTTPAGATGDFDYVLIRGLTQFTTSDAVTSETSAKTMTIGTVTDLTPVTDTDITFTHGEVAGGRDINNGAGARPYSIEVDPASKSWERVYQRAKYIQRRGSTTQIDGIDGEAYRGETLQVEYNAETGNFTEGLVVTASGGGTGVIVAVHDDGTTGDLILRAVRNSAGFTGTITDTSTGSATIASTRSIPTLKFAPLGSMAGTLWQGAPGMVPVLANIAAGRAQDYSLVDDDGSVQNPPNTVSISANGVAVDDWIFIGRLDAPFPGGSLVKDEYTSHATLNAVGDQTFDVTTAISQEAPPSGVVRVPYAADAEDRYVYASWSGTTFTLVVIPTGTVTTADATGVTLTDSGATFVTDGVIPGMLVRNTTDGSQGIVKTVVSETEITLDGVGLTGGTENDWDLTDAYDINRLVRTYDSGDTAYVPFLDEKVLSGTTASTTIIQSVDISTIVRDRQGPGQPAADPIQPFVAGGTISSTGQSSNIIRTPDTISP